MNNLTPLSQINLKNLSRKEKLELLKLLELKEQKIKQQPLDYYNCYKPLRHEKQIEFHTSLAPIRVLLWGNRVGKTEAGGMEAAYYLTDTHPHRTIGPNIEGWISCPSFDLQVDGTQKKLERYLGDQIEHIDYLRGNIWKNVRIKKTGSLATFKSYEQGREKFQSAGKRFIWNDEEPPADVWEEQMMRQEAGMPLDVWLTMTPVNGMTWVYDDIFMDTGNPRLFCSQAGWDDNPYLLEDQKILMLGNLKSPEAIAVRKSGLFVSRVGLVCSWFRRNKHLRDYKEFPQDWQYYEVLDGGWSDPACWLLIGIDNDGNIHIIDGYRERELGAEQIKEKRDARSTGIMIRRGYSDNDNPRLNTDLSKLGMSLISVVKQPNEKKSWDEILADKLSEYGSVQKGTGEPRLYISNNLTRLNEKTNKPENWFVQEIENLKWFEQKHKEGSEIKPLWDDHRRFGHHFDGIRALSYFLIMYNKPVDDKKTVTSNAAKIKKWSV